MVQKTKPPAPIQPQDIKPEAIVINKSVKTDWNYQESIKKVQGMYLTWKTASVELLNELWVAKQAITLDGTRTSGLPRKGALSWSKYIRECFEDLGGPSKRSIDSYLARYSKAGFVKTAKPTAIIVSDPSKVIIQNPVRIVDHIKFDIYLPEYDLTYTQSIAA